MFRNLKYRLSFMFGRMEHFYSRILFLSLLITFIFVWYKNYDVVYYLSIVNILLWIFYYVNHRLEKKFHQGK